MSPGNPYAPTLIASLQAPVDNARLLQHSMGMRPYEVFLVWQVRDQRTLLWREDLRIQILPVHVPALDDAAVVLGEGGLFKEGAIALLEISPAKFEERLLSGYRDGQPWAQADNDREFFYEVVHVRRCPGDPEPQRHRFTLASVPYHDAEDFQYRVSITPQQVDRDGEGKDRALLKKSHLKRPVVTT